MQRSCTHSPTCDAAMPGLGQSRDRADARHADQTPWRRAIAIYRAYRAWLRRRRDERALMQLDDRMLSDIGLKRSDIARATREGGIHRPR